MQAHIPYIKHPCCILFRGCIALYFFQCAFLGCFKSTLTYRWHHCFEHVFRHNCQRVRGLLRAVLRGGQTRTDRPRQRIRLRVATVVAWRGPASGMGQSERDVVDFRWASHLRGLPGGVCRLRDAATPQVVSLQHASRVLRVRLFLRRHRRSHCTHCHITPPAGARRRLLQNGSGESLRLQVRR